MAYREEGHGEHHPHDVKYVAVFIALCCFTGLSIAFDMFEYSSHALKIVLVMGVAAAKATCVMMFFMHLKFEGNWKYILLAPTTILAIGLPVALMPDVAVSYYIKDVPQVDDYDEAMRHHQHGSHDGEHHVDEAHEAGEHHDDAHGKGEHAHESESAGNKEDDSAKSTEDAPAEDQ